MKFCALLACKNRDVKNKKTSGIKHHVFPTDDAIREEWISFVNKFNRTTGWTTKANKGAFLCEDHFEKGLYTLTGRLVHHAVPTQGSQFTAEKAFSTVHECVQEVAGAS
ncbi:THAP domain-containing protein 6-like [Thrips palmi]|uniref:THAP domain-containing protein 6-like n=1 Tax=Thrips palmi TaxID=161013 RepID=A0A6P8ZMW4_THRPL|nr:THAP domain-containing protein 6-like [Thrips palmi]